eukprot:519750_1
MAAAAGSGSVIRDLSKARKEVVRLISTLSAHEKKLLSSDWDSFDKFFKDFRTFKISAEYSSSCYGPCENAIQLLKDIQTLKLAQRAIEFGIDKDALKTAKNKMDDAMVGKYKADEDKVLDPEYLGLSTMAFGMIERRIDGTDMKQRALAWDAITGYLIKKLDLKQFLTKKGVTSDNYIVQELIAKGKKAKSGYYNELEGLFDDSFDYRYHDIHSAHSLPFDDHSHYQPRISGEYNGVSDSGSSLLIGGVIGASSIVIVMLIFCLGLAFGMVIYWGYSQKRALDVKRNKVEMRNWINDDEDRNEV